MTSAGSGPLGLPRTELKAASCSANDLVLLKNRNGFSTCQTRSAAHAELAPMLTKVPTSHAVVASVLRRMKSPLAPPCRYESCTGGERGPKFTKRYTN